MLVMQQGGARRRPGTIHLRSCIDSTKKSRLIPFVFSNDETNAIEISPTSPYIRAVYSSGATAAIGIPSSLTAGFQNATAYTEAEIDEIQYQQIGDLLYLVHPNHMPIVIARTALAQFTSYLYFDVPITTTVGIQDRFPYRDVNITGTTISSSGTTGSVTITASTVLFSPLHVGSIWKKDTGGTPGYFVITGYTNSQTVTATVLVAITTGATTGWAEGAWSSYRGYPRSISYYQYRLYLASNASQPDRFWASASSLITKFQKGTNEADPFTNSITSSPYVNQIQWMNVQKKMVMGTLGAEHVVEGFDITAPISPTNPSNINADTIYGSVYRQALRYDNVLSFIHRTGKKLMELSFNFNEDQFNATDLSVLAEHMPQKQFDRLNDGTEGLPWLNNLAWQSSENILWIQDYNGGLFACTRDKVNNVTGFAFQKIAGITSTYGPAMVRSVCVIPPSNPTGINRGEIQDVVFVCVERYINGASYFSIERFACIHDHQINPGPMIAFNALSIYSDSSVLKEYVAGNESTLFGGYDHLIGESVSIVADGSYIGEVVPQTSSELITNGTAETGSLGSNVYAFADAPGTAPVDGIGGSPTSTIAVTAVSPISGTYSYLWTRAAGNVQGEGFSIDFTVNGSDKGKVFALTFVHDLIAAYTKFPNIYIYNVDTASYLELTMFTPGFYYHNGTAAQVSEGKLSFAPSAVDNHYLNQTIKFLFKTDSTSTNYRVIFHVPYTASDAATIRFDGFSIKATGCIELSNAANRVIGGLNYESVIKTLKSEAGSVIGSAQMLPKKIEKVGIRFFNTVGAKFSRDGVDFDSIPFRPNDLAMEDPIPTFTGDKIVDYPTNWDRDAQLVIKQDIPMPMNVLGIARRGTTNE